VSQVKRVTSNDEILGAIPSGGKVFAFVRPPKALHFAVLASVSVVVSEYVVNTVKS